MTYSLFALFAVNLTFALLFADTNNAYVTILSSFAAGFTLAALISKVLK